MTDVFADVVREKRALLLNAAVRCAEVLGVFRYLAGGGSGLATVGELALELDVAAHRLEPLLDLLAAERVLVREHTLDSPSYGMLTAPSIARLNGGDWDLLAQVLRTDEPLESDDYLPEYLRYVEERSDLVAPLLWSAVAPPSGRLLDLGGGLGAYSRAYTCRNAHNAATLVDLPKVTEIAVASGPGERRIDIVACDAREFASDEGYDVALLANLLHLYGDSDCVRMLERAAAALRPGGTLVIKDFFVEPDRSGPLVSLYFAVNMAIYTTAGEVRPTERLTAWCSGAGLTQIRVLRLPEVPEGVIVSGIRH